MAHYDVVIIGSGVGGGAVAYQLADSNLKVLILERGLRLPREPQNWEPEAVFVQQRYRTSEKWWAGKKSFNPGMFYYVGGNTKFYGSAMFRFRERDFLDVQHAEGISPKWPIDYGELENWYGKAEEIFGVRGLAGVDPTEPKRSGLYNFDPVPHEPEIARIESRLRAQGLNPFPMPSTIDFGNGGRCIRCSNCDAFPCKIDAKGDAEICLVLPACKSPNVTLQVGAMAEKLETDPTGRKVIAVIANVGGKPVRISADTFVLSAGAVNSAALLLRSADSKNSRGLANSSDQVGRNYMTHNTSALMAIHPLKHNKTRFPKTLAVHDFYFGGGADDTPLGSLQLLGKIKEPMLRDSLNFIPGFVRSAIAQRSVDWYAQSEDLPHQESRVTVRSDGAINLHWHRTNMKAHRTWVSKCKQILRNTGYPIVISKEFGTNVVSHQCGTTRFGDHPSNSVLDEFCNSWDHDNLYVVDAGFFPSSAAVNPALTIAAQGLRVGSHLRKKLSA